jgi:hypothetical protein
MHAQDVNPSPPTATPIHLTTPQLSIVHGPFNAAKLEPVASGLTAIDIQPPAGMADFASGSKANNP